MVYVVSAYSQASEPLWVGQDEHEPSLTADSPKSLDDILDRATIGSLIHEDGHRLVTSRRVAYWRVHVDGVCHLVSVTAFGRMAGVRNYQARRSSDVAAVPVVGALPRPGTYIEESRGTLSLCLGEGMPVPTDDFRRRDKWGDVGFLLATATRTKRGDGYSRFGYLINNVFNGYTYHIEGNKDMARLELGGLYSASEIAAILAMV